MATYLDDFTGTAGTDLSGRTASGSWTWGKTGGTNAATISAANAASVSAGSAAQRSVYTVPSGVGGPQYAKSVRTTSGVDAGPGVRLADDGSGLRGYFTRHSTTVIIARRISTAGVYTTIGSFTDTGVSTDVIEIQANGSTLKVLRNGVQVGTDITDSTWTTGLPGFFVGAASAVTSLIDTFEAGDLGSGVVIPVFMGHYRQQGMA